MFLGAIKGTVFKILNHNFCPQKLSRNYLEIIIIYNYLEIIKKLPLFLCFSLFKFCV